MRAAGGGRQDVQSRAGRRWQHDARPRYRGERRRSNKRPFRADGSRRVERGAAQEQCSSDDHRRGACRAGADCQRGHVDGQPDFVCLPVAALQHRLDHLRKRHRRDGSHLRRSPRRPRLPPAGGGTARTDNRSGTATSNRRQWFEPTTPITNARPDASHPLGHVPGSDGSTCASAFVTTSRVTSAILVSETRPGVRPRTGVSPLASPRGRAVPTREAGSRRSASVGRVATRSPCVRRTRRADEPAGSRARSAGSSKAVAGTARRSGASQSISMTRRFRHPAHLRGRGESSGIERRCSLAAGLPLYRL